MSKKKVAVFAGQINTVGEDVGSDEGFWVGCVIGDWVGSTDGAAEGLTVGDAERGRNSIT